MQDLVSERGYTIKIWDAFRPASAQYKLWEICPNPRYVANSNKGYSSHSKGNTIDITLINKDGSEIEMPTDFNDFSSMADRNYSDCSVLASNNEKYLEELMKKNGFNLYSEEWWHGYR